MHRRYVAVIVSGVIQCCVLVAAMAAGCSPPTERVDADTGSLRTGELPCDVNHVLTTVCQHCHQSPPINDAPFPLVTYADTQVVVNGAPIYKYMQAALQAGRMPAPPVTLSNEDRALLLAWLRAGAPPRQTNSCASDSAPSLDAADAGEAGDAADASLDASSDADLAADACADADDAAPTVHVTDACTGY